MSLPVRGARGFGAEGEQTMIHVLAVGDSSIDREVIAALLRSSKYHETTLNNGTKVLELLGMEPNVNMIITDNWMPKMTGYGLLKRIKESSKMRGIPVIIMSSENMFGRRSRRFLVEACEAI
ncbi:two-component response regulator ORR6-like [Zingiber officinale]|uniref:two-component response regulator ORR6-like n=1 Tax=Zingiber officinale TaxID=94328 RepID=UPI001C4AA19E|nr:two-component response regulator ORR6-like [Zingiber officinale]